MFTAQAPNGQSHETTLAQIAATEFGLPLEHVSIRWGDTSFSPYSALGTGGSRAATMASGSTLLATREVKRKVLDYAADMLEAAAEDLKIADASVFVGGDPASGLSLGEVAQMIYFLASGWRGTGSALRRHFPGATWRLVGRHPRLHRRGRPPRPEP